MLLDDGSLAQLFDIDSCGIIFDLICDAIDFMNILWFAWFNAHYDFVSATTTTTQNRLHSAEIMISKINSSSKYSHKWMKCVKQRSFCYLSTMICIIVHQHGALGFCRTLTISEWIMCEFTVTTMNLKSSPKTPTTQSTRFSLVHTHTTKPTNSYMYSKLNHWTSLKSKPQ